MRASGARSRSLIASRTGYETAWSLRVRVERRSARARSVDELDARAAGEPHARSEEVGRYIGVAVGVAGVLICQLLEQPATFHTILL